MVDSGVYFRRPIGFLRCVQEKVIERQCGDSRLVSQYIVLQPYLPAVHPWFGLGSDGHRQPVLYPPDRLGSAEVHPVEVLHRAFLMDIRLFRHEAFAVGPINATRPVMVLVGALLVFGERLNLYQWVGVALAVLSFFMLSRSGKKEGIDFRHDKWIYFIVLASVLGAVSGLYDKYLMASPENGGVGLDRMVVQSCYNLYQLVMMGVMMLLLWWPRRKQTTPFRWDWCILPISLFLSAADFVYFYALSLDGAMISIVSMVRRGSVVVSFLFGAMVFREKNLQSKAVDLVLVLLGMVFLYLGSR